MNKTPTLYPWLQTAWQELLRERDRWPHALLLTGEPGIGKRAFAVYLAQFLLCEDTQKSTQPCGVCDGCRWFLAGNHPDYRVLQPEDAEEERPDETESKKAKKKSEVIRVEDVRALADFVNLSAHRRSVRVTLVVPADTMNVAAANAFLKTLEEPPAGAIFILVADHWRRLLPTIRSRCRVFPLALPDSSVAMQWLNAHGVVNPALHLAHTGGAPLAAMDDAAAEWLAVRQNFLTQIAEPATLDVLKLCTELDKAKLDTDLVITWLQKWIYDLISLGLAGKIRYYPDWQDALTRLAPRAPQLMQYVNQLTDAQKLSRHPLNQRLVFENLLFAYVDALRGPSRQGKI
ncbi:DNA polymerase III subunit delta' [Deefgea piscis]|uniref:DNA polymerase III subunit delta' n=1 Tax=Deefgea piscis TaxID=2739061 RepID=A0A6M8SRZ0_9NEIS|nr:DNA polymerase III subunit delta' [Deefgea piscis]QKJ68082.1 DNA polymerase III subunit delta' [Deefgea piscis]